MEEILEQRLGDLGIPLVMNLPLGHGMPNVHALRGGIDAWSLEVDSSIRRYTVS